MKALGLVLKIVGGLLAVVVIAIGVIIATVDPNDYRDEITTAVKDHTGRDLEVKNMTLSIFPQLGINLESASLSNAPGFSSQPFLSVDKVHVGAAIIPLLSKQLEVDTLTLHGLNLTLEKNADGVTNWDDLTGKKDGKERKDEQEQESSMDKLASLNFGGIDIQNGQIHWKDQQNQQNVDLTNLNLTTGTITFGEFFDVALTASTQVSNPQITSDLQVNLQAKLDQSGQYAIRNLTVNNTTSGKGIPVKQATTAISLPSFTLENSQLAIATLTVDYDIVGGADFPLETIKGQLSISDLSGQLEQQQFAAKSISINSDLTGEAIPGGKSQVKVDTSANLDLQKQTAKLPSFTIQAMDLNAKGSVEANQIIDDLAVNTNVQVAKTNLRNLLTKLQVTLPDMSDKNTLTQFAANVTASFNKANQSLTISKLNVNLDDSTLDGKVRVSNFSAPQVRYDLALNKINANRYLPTKQPETTKTENTPETEIQLPVELLRKLDVKGTLKVGHLTYDKLNPKNILMTLQAQKGNIQVAPLRADIFKTRINTEAGLDVRAETPKYTAKVIADNVPIGDVLLSLADTDKLSGTGSVNAKINTSGNKISDFKKSLNGTVFLNLKDGAVKGFNLAQAIRDAKAKISGKPASKTDPEAKTDFSELVASASIKNGIVTTKKLSAKAPFMRVNGSGTVDLPKESLNYLVKTKIVGSDKGQGGPELKELNGLTIPVKLKGPYTSPSVSLDLESLLEQKVKADIEKKKEEVVKDVQKQVEDKLKDSLLKGFKF